MKNPPHSNPHRWTCWIIGLASLVWLLLRSGTNPRRLAYPCQRAALASSLTLLGPLLTGLGITAAIRMLRRRTPVGLAGMIGLATMLCLWQTASTVRPLDAARTIALALPTWTSPSAVSNVYLVPDVPVPQCSVDGGQLASSGPCSNAATALADQGIERLVAEMDRRGEPFYRTAGDPTGIVAANSVVVIKINNQWGTYGDGSGYGRLCTSSDTLKGLIWAIVNHPDGFTGEVVVAENTQWVNASFDTSPANAEDQDQSYQDVVDVFTDLGYAVSTYAWDELGDTLLSGGTVGGGYPPGEYINGNASDGYILVEDPAGSGSNELSYPKFRTAEGTRVSMRYGIWNGSSYDSGRLCFINLPVLKRHGMAGATIAWKNLIGFITIENDGARFGGWDPMHGYFWGYQELGDTDYGLIGRQLALIRAPDLNIVDAIWVATQDNTSGPAVRENLLLASTDPFAVDWYTSEHVLRPVAEWDAQDSSAARSGTFRSATRVNQNAAKAVWHGTYPYIDLLDSYNGSTPSSNETNQMNVYQAGATTACELSCTATVATNAQVGTAVSFQATATATGCTAQPAYSWTFSDGGSASGQNLSHSFSVAGTYTWSLNVSAGAEVCTRSGSIVVGGSTGELDYLVPAVTHAPGSEGTQWRTALACSNPSSSATVQLTLTLVSDSGQLSRSRSLPPLGSAEWNDVIVDLFGYSQQAEVQGAVYLEADRPVLATSRTYNQTATGTYGQYLPALTLADCLAAGDVGFLLQLKGNASFRSNLGLANLGASECTVRVTLYNGSGTALGRSVNLSVAAGRWSQRSDIIAAANAGSQNLALARLEVQSGCQSVWAYASVVDRRTGDATTIPVLIP